MNILKRIVNLIHGRKTEIIDGKQITYAGRREARRSYRAIANNIMKTKRILLLILTLTPLTNYAGHYDVYLADQAHRYPPMFHLWDTKQSSGTVNIECSSMYGAWQVYRWYFMSVLYPSASTETRGAQK